MPTWQEKVDAAAIKKRLYVKSLMAGKTLKDAALDAGYKPGNARSMGSKLKKEKDVIKLVDKALNRNNVTIERCAKEINKGIEKGKLGQHIDYLELAFRLRGLGGRVQQNNNTQINVLNPDSLHRLIEAYNASNGVVNEPIDVTEDVINDDDDKATEDNKE